MIRYIILILILTLLWVIPIDALQESWQYKEGQCELAAKDYQDVYGGHIMFIQPLKDGGAYDFGPYSGHFVNKAWNKERGIYYIDWQSQTYFNNTDEIKNWYYNTTGKKSEIYDMNDGGAPFPMIWHY